MAVTASFDGITADAAGASFTLTPGVQPSRGRIVLEAGTSIGSVPQSGTLIISDGTTSVSLTNVYVHSKGTRETKAGTVIECSLKDKRWEWQYAGPFTKQYNGENGLGTAATANAIADDLVNAFLGASPTSNAMPTSVSPRKTYIGVAPAQALESLCREYGCIVTMDYDETVKIQKRNVGTLSAGTDSSSRSVGTAYPSAPTQVKVFGGKKVYQRAVALLPIGLDKDGKYKLLEDLSYAPDTSSIQYEGGFGTMTQGWFMGLVNPDGTPDLEAQLLAQQTIFKTYMLTNYVPCLGELSDLEQTKDSVGADVHPIRQKPYVVGKIHVKDPGKGDVLAPPSIRRKGFSFDNKLGIFKFQNSMYEVATIEAGPKAMTFTASNDRITEDVDADSFADIDVGDPVVVTGTVDNNGRYTVSAVSAGDDYIEVDQALTDETSIATAVVSSVASGHKTDRYVSASLSGVIAYACGIPALDYAEAEYFTKLVTGGPVSGSGTAILKKPELVVHYIKSAPQIAIHHTMQTGATDCTVEVTGTSLVVVVTGGANAGTYTGTFAAYPTLQDMVDVISGLAIDVVAALIGTPETETTNLEVLAATSCYGWDNKQNVTADGPVGTTAGNEESDADTEADIIGAEFLDQFISGNEARDEERNTIDLLTFNGIISQIGWSVNKGGTKTNVTLGWEWTKPGSSNEREKGFKAEAKADGKEAMVAATQKELGEEAAPTLATPATGAGGSPADLPPSEAGRRVATLQSGELDCPLGGLVAVKGMNSTTGYLEVGRPSASTDKILMIAAQSLSADETGTFYESGTWPLAMASTSGVVPGDLLKPDASQYTATKDNTDGFIPVVAVAETNAWVLVKMGAFTAAAAAGTDNSLLVEITADTGTDLWTVKAWQWNDTLGATYTSVQGSDDAYEVGDVVRMDKDDNDDWVIIPGISVWH